ncbi:MAG: helix-turn-helix domain-containing protein, partial [Draconibacterium sp.]|nr:helix-turn-helix domain-containing protein [Draconibacterium sp.]
VISDVKMPEMNGIEFTRKFKSNPKTSHIPLILLTGQSETEKQLEGLKSGADAYITKPFQIDLLEIRIENFLKGRMQLTEYLQRDKISKPKEIQLASQDEKLLERVVNCIEKHISNSDLNIDKVCSETGLSHSILYRKIKNLTGQTINEFIRTVRIRRAAQLLRTKKFAVSEVMYETGFSNHSYFSKCFRKLYKISPKEYIDQV